MKKKIALLSAAFCALILAACGSNTGGSTNSSTDSSDSSSTPEPTHVHSVAKVDGKAPTCTKEGSVECYFCWDCKSYFLDENAEEEITKEETVVAKLPHNGKKIEQTDPTCGESGIVEHWECTECFSTFSDEACTKRLTASQLVLPSTEHDLVYFDGYPVNGTENGMLEHWFCNNCKGYFLSEEASENVGEEGTILYSAVNLLDFIVEIPSGRDPVVLQLSDTQIIDGAQSRPEQSSGDRITYATTLIPKYCYNYLTEIVTATKPDFIILTGDLVYGKYDDNGTALQGLIRCMDSFKIPWAPVFGNHENESKMGVDWQCEQLENAEYCLFEQGELTGNGNYSVGLVQDGVIKRAFYMLDSNGCGEASAESLANGHTSTSVGFANNQVEWYTAEITALKELSPSTKISFAYHIQQAVFGEAYAKYGFNQSNKYQDINIDKLENKADGDFGYIGRQMKTDWDGAKKVYNGMKALGVDSIFVGHEHCNSASVVYEGIRFQYGQKSSEYDRYNQIDANGNITATYLYNKTGTPLIGGSVIVLSDTDGSIEDAYIYYCKNTTANT